MKSKSSLDRRSFAKTLTFATAYSSLLGKSWTHLVAGEVRLASTSTVGTLRLKLGDFPALQTESGSVRLGFNPLRGDLQPDGQFYPVIINRGPNNAFYALNSRCSHQACSVNPMDPFSNRVSCSCHGSEYAIDGRRLTGPATAALSRYTITFDGKDSLEVQIPGLGYSVVGTSVAGGPNGVARFRLDFRALRNIEYEVQFRDSMDKKAISVPFATTLEGAPDQSMFTSATTANASLFVERASAAGFYSVVALVKEI